MIEVSQERHDVLRTGSALLSRAIGELNPANTVNLSGVWLHMLQSLSSAPPIQYWLLWQAFIKYRLKSRQLLL